MKSRTNVFVNLIWRFAERCGSQLVQLLVSIVLARLLAPEVFGTVSLVIVFSSILQVFVDSGLGNALIQKKNADDLDFSSVFYFNIVWCIVLYLGVYVMAPYIATYFNDISMTPIIRVLCLTVVISGVKNVQQAYVSKTLQFKKFFYSTATGIIVSAIIGIWMAIENYGVWALVAQKLINIFVDTLVLWITVEWKPKLIFSWSRLKSLISYGWKLLASALLDTVYENIVQLVIGKKYNESDLAFYNQGKQYPYLLVNNINLAIDSVLLPVMSNEQDNRERVKEMTKRAVKTSTYIMGPLMIGLFVTAPYVIKLLLTDKWMECVFYLRVFCIMYMFFPIQTANLNAIKALGRSDLFLKLEIEKKVVGIFLLIITMQFGVKAMTCSLLVGSFISQMINSRPNKKLLNYGYIDQLKDIFPNIILSVFMGVCVGTIARISLSFYISLIVQIFVGVMVYVLGSIIMKNESYIYLKGIIMSFVIKRRK